MNIPDDVIELAARKMLKRQEFAPTWDSLDDIEREIWLEGAQEVVGSIAPYLAFAALMEAADAAQGDDLTAAAEVIYDLRARAAQGLVDTL